MGDMGATNSHDDNDILYVGGSGQGNYTKIQDAVDNASDGDTVFVYDDSSPYYENVIIDMSISLIGEDKNTTVIDGGSQTGHVVEIFATHVTISGFTTQNGEGFSIFSDYTTISSNIIGPHTDSIGIYMDGCFNCVIEDNVISSNNDGIWLLFGGQN